MSFTDLVLGLDPLPYAIAPTWRWWVFGVAAVLPWVLMAWRDLRTTLLSERAGAGLAMGGLAIAFFHGHIVTALTGGLVFGGTLLFAALLVGVAKRNGPVLGAGDIPLAMAIGVWTGPALSLFLLLAGGYQLLAFALARGFEALVRKGREAEGAEGLPSPVLANEEEAIADPVPARGLPFAPALVAAGLTLVGLGGWL